MKASNIVTAALFVVLAATAQVSVADTPVEKPEIGKYQGALRDAWLDGKLETALLFNEHLNSFAIDTDVKNRTAFLSGSVDSDIERDLAEQIAKSVDGIKDVKSNLTVDGAATASASKAENRDASKRFREGVLNATLTARVKSNLILNKHTKARHINVDSSNGVVTLTGAVDSTEEEELALVLAKNTKGVDGLINNLTVVEDEEAE